MYAVLMETSSYDYESWLYFIKYEGNEDNLKFLLEQIDMIRECSMFDEDITIFDMDLLNLVSDKTAREMCMLELNSVSYHRMFDGVLKRVDFGFKRKDSDEKKMTRMYKLIGDGKIDQFVNGEYVDESHVGDDDSVTDSGNESDDDSVHSMMEDMANVSVVDDKIPAIISNVGGDKKKKRKK